jgi:hypothetical protein
MCHFWVPLNNGGYTQRGGKEKQSGYLDDYGPRVMKEIDFPKSRLMGKILAAVKRGAECKQENPTASPSNGNGFRPHATLGRTCPSHSAHRNFTLFFPQRESFPLQ